MTREAILRALRLLSEELDEAGTHGELCLFGGTVMVLAYAARPATRDVDAIFQPTQSVRTAARRVAMAEGLPEDWLNDGVKGYLSTRHATTTGDLPQFPALRLTMPVPEYLLAMKCMAARLTGTTGEPSDVADIRFLIRQLRLRSAAEVLDLVVQYYPTQRISPKTQYVVEGLFEEEQP